MTNFLKRLTSRLAGKTSDDQTPKDTVGTRCRASMPQKQDDVVGPRSCAAAPDNSQFKTEPSPFENLTYNRNGKIARLPRDLRDRINLALFNRCTAKDLARALNQMPVVQAVLTQYFDGRPLRRQNIDEWRHGGYRDWLHHRQLLEQQRELAADAKDLSDTAKGTAESLFGILTLDYANLMMNGDKDPEEFEKHRKKLSLISHDIARMHRCHINHRRVQVQESRLERDEEKTTEQLHFKFMEWVENPAIRRACILEPMEANRRTRQKMGMPPTSDDLLVEQLTRNDPYFNPPAKKPGKSKPKPAEKPSDSSRTGVSPVSDSKPEPTLPPASEKPSDVQEQEDMVGTLASVASAVSSVVPTRSSASGADQRVSPPAPQGESAPDNSKLNSQNSTLPSNPSSSYEGKTNTQIIAEMEEKHLREKAARLNPSLKKSSEVQGQKDGGEGELNSKLKPQHSTLTTSPGSSPWDTFSEPVHIYSGFRHPSALTRSDLSGSTLG